MLRMLKVSVILRLCALTVPLFLTAVIVWGPRYAFWLNLVFHIFLSRSLSPLSYVCSFQLDFLADFIYELSLVYVS